MLSPNPHLLVSLSHTHTTPAPPPLPPPKITNQRKRVHYSTDKVQQLRISSKNAWLVRAKTNLQFCAYWFPRTFPFPCSIQHTERFFFLSFLFLSPVFDHVFVVLMCIWVLTVSCFILKVSNLLTIDNNSSVLFILWRERRWSFWVLQLYHKTDHLTSKKQLYFLWKFWIVEFQVQ